MNSINENGQSNNQATLNKRADDTEPEQREWIVEYPQTFEFYAPGDGKKLTIQGRNDCSIHLSVSDIDRGWSPQECRDFGQAMRLWADMVRDWRTLYPNETPQQQPKTMQECIRQMQILYYGIVDTERKNFASALRDQFEQLGGKVAEAHNTADAALREATWLREQIRAFTHSNRWHKLVSGGLLALFLAQCIAYALKGF